jgi:hypothetical protein
MAIRDDKQFFSEDLSAIIGAATTYSDTLDFGSTASMDPGIGTQQYININFGPDTVADTSMTFAITVVEGAAATPTTTGYILITPTYTKAEFDAAKALNKDAGVNICIPLPPRRVQLRYMRLKIVTTTAGWTAGTINAWLSSAPIWTDIVDA